MEINNLEGAHYPADLPNDASQPSGLVAKADGQEMESLALEWGPVGGMLAELEGGVSPKKSRWLARAGYHIL